MGSLTKTNGFEQCVKCTICTAYCPIIQTNPLFPGPKQAGPDGERLRLRNRSYFDESLKYCLNCKRCDVACPSGVKISDIIQTARDRFGSGKVSLRDSMMSNTDLMGHVAVPFAPVVNAVLGNDLARKAIDSVAGVARKAPLPDFASRTFESVFKRSLAQSQTAYSKSVNYFHGCYVNYMFPSLGVDFVRLMNALGYGVKLLDGEKCCGVAMIAAGSFGKARSRARHNVEVLSKASGPVLTTSTTCALTMRDEYPEVLGVDNSVVRSRISFVLKFVCEVLERGEATLKFKPDFHARVAYHVPCHLERLGWSIFTRELMAMIPGLEVVLLDSACCGLAGTYGCKKENYEVSQAVGRKLFRQIEEVAPDFVITECETCKWQIERSTGFKVKHPLSLLVEALELN